MKLLLVVVVFVVLGSSSLAKLSEPKVQVYSYSPGEFGKENVLICHVSGFHPPDINIELLKNEVEIPGAKQTDLAFEQGWKFHLTKSVSFTPQNKEEYSCKVRHMNNVKKFVWEADM
ncbi:beta-2-microglobulin-like [Colossoma macropomum]|uniref:beta-2-microglobulin-like n=1 Tax=Colossoma macropomum TaxID=42526 RepID=UPI001863FA9C|nr:beta-2-microglobulin-like [Colossoma macropomum]